MRIVCNALGIGHSTDWGKYLGVPLIHGRVTKGTYRELIEKVNNKVSGWKSKVLSLAGRATLVSSVTSSIPTYTMLTTRLPRVTRDTMDMLNHR